MSNPLTTQELNDLINKHNSLPRNNPLRKELLNKETLSRLYLQFSVVEVKKMFHVHHRRLKLSQERPTCRGPTQKYVENNIDKIKEYIGQGMTNKEILLELNIDRGSHHSLTSILNKYNISSSYYYR